MELSYNCPHCLSHLLIGKELILTVKSEKFHKKGLLIMNPDLGNYTIRNHPSIKFEAGENVEFYCPVCAKNLTANNINPKLVHLIMSKEGKEFNIYFSKIAGEHTTIKIEANNIIEKFGEDSSSYLSYFSDRLKKALQEK